MKNLLSIPSLKLFFIEKRSQLLNILLLFAWAFIQYKLGYRFNGLFLILFIAFLFFSRQQNSLLLIIPIIVALIFGTHLLDTLTDLRKTDSIVVQYHGETLKKIFTPNSGQEVLPTKVQEVLSLLSENKVNSYQLSNQIIQDSETYQRIIESVWPRELTDTSKYFVITPAEKQKYLACDEIDQREDILLVYCR